MIKEDEILTGEHLAWLWEEYVNFDPKKLRSWLKGISAKGLARLSKLLQLGLSKNQDQAIERIIISLSRGNYPYDPFHPRLKKTQIKKQKKKNEPSFIPQDHQKKYNFVKRYSPDTLPSLENIKALNKEYQRLKAFYKYVQHFPIEFDKVKKGNADLEHTYKSLILSHGSIVKKTPRLKTLEEVKDKMKEQFSSQTEISLADVTRLIETMMQGEIKTLHQKGADNYDN